MKSISGKETLDLKEMGIVDKGIYNTVFSVRLEYKGVKYNLSNNVYFRVD